MLKATFSSSDEQAHICIVMRINYIFQIRNRFIFLESNLKLTISFCQISRIYQQTYFIPMFMAS